MVTLVLMFLVVLAILNIIRNHKTRRVDEPDSVEADLVQLVNELLNRKGDAGRYASRFLGKRIYVEPWTESVDPSESHYPQALIVEKVKIGVDEEISYHLARVLGVSEAIRGVVWLMPSAGGVLACYPSVGKTAYCSKQSSWHEVKVTVF